MARTVQECYDYIVTNLVTTFAAEGVTINPALWSKTNNIRLMCYSVAVAQSLSEQLQDVNISKMQAIQLASSAANIQWLQTTILKFQYSATTPQVLTILAGIPQYTIENAALRIVTSCAIQVPVLTGVCNIKVAKGTSTLAALSAPELTSLQSYIDIIGCAGINYIVSSTTSDKLYIKADVYYKGDYQPVIQANVITAIDDYLLNLSKTRFGGDVLMSDLELLIKGVDGVNDVKFDRVSLRYDAQSLFAGINLTLAGTVVNRKYLMGSGYAIQETTVGSTFADTLNFIAE
jgi:hypothetical protein